MIDVLNEDLIDPHTACKLPALRNRQTGKACHLSQFYRYIQTGARAVDGSRVRLEVVKTPSGLKTSREAVVRFIAALTDPNAPPLATKSRKRAQADAERELAAAGFEVGGA